MNPLRLLLGNPWVILAIVVALGSAGTGLYLKGRSDGAAVTDASWVAKEAKLDKIAAAQLASALKAKTAVEKLLAEISAKVESDALKNLADVDAAYRRGVSSGRVFIDRQGTCAPSGGDGMPEGGTTSGDPNPGATGCRLSDAARSFLLDFARDADSAAVYGQAGHQYAVGVQGAMVAP